MHKKIQNQKHFENVACFQITNYNIFEGGTTVVYFRYPILLVPLLKLDLVPILSLPVILYTFSIVFYRPV